MIFLVSCTCRGFIHATSSLTVFAILNSHGKKKEVTHQEHEGSNVQIPDAAGFKVHSLRSLGGLSSIPLLPLLKLPLIKKTLLLWLKAP